MRILALLDGLIPAGFMESIQKGNLESVGIAADFLQERGDLHKALMVRAIYHRIHGRRNIMEQINNKSFAVMNIEDDRGKTRRLSQITTKTPPDHIVITSILPRVAIVTPGVSIEIISINSDIGGRSLHCQKFIIGDLAKWECRGVVSFGHVSSITAKTITLSGNRKSSRKIAQFVVTNIVLSWRADFMDWISRIVQNS